jgi:hypothetical protein
MPSSSSWRHYSADSSCTARSCRRSCRCAALWIIERVLTAAHRSGVRDAFEDNFRRGFELGAQLVVHVGGKEVVSLAGAVDGLANEFGTPYSADSLQIVFSSTKVMESLVIAMLHDRGRLNLSAPIAQFWPAFAAPGTAKARVTVAELMRHEAGLDAFDAPLPWEAFLGQGAADVTKRVIESSQPVWSTASRRAYHGLTRGLVANELVKLVDEKHRSLGQFFEEVGGYRPVRVCPCMRLCEPSRPFARRAELRAVFCYARARDTPLNASIRDTVPPRRPLACRRSALLSAAPSGSASPPRSTPVCSPCASGPCCSACCA